MTQRGNHFLRPLISVLALACIAAGCATQGPWGPEPSAFEHGGSDRTSIFDAVPGRSALASGGTIPADRVDGDFPGGYNVAAGPHEALFVLGGVLGARNFSGLPYVSRVDAGSLERVWTTDLVTRRPAWSYPGLVGVLRDGGVVAVAGRSMVRLDARSGAITARTELPAGAAPDDTAYNGFIALHDGRLLAKSLHRPTGCRIDGFQAFLQCQGPQENSRLVLLDPVTLRVLQTVELSEPVGGRITSIRKGATDEIYIAGADNVFRFRYAGRRLTPDPAWGPIRYRENGETTGAAVTAFGPYVVVQTNASPSGDPVRLTVISRSNPNERYSVQPFATRRGARSFSPSKPTTDWANRRIYVVERFGGSVALDFSPGRGLRVAWSAPERSINFTALYGAPEDRLFVQTEIMEGDPPDNPLLYRADRIVFRNPSNGDVLAGTAPLAPAPGLNVTPGKAGVMWFLGVEGSLFRVAYARSTR